MLIDAIILVVLLISILIAFFRGFIKEILTLFGLFGAGLAALYLGPIVEPHIYDFFVDPNAEEPGKLFGIIPFSFVAKIGGYGLVFIIFIITLSLLSHFLSEAAEKIGLGALDRTLGILFGALRGALLVGLLYLPAYLFLDDETKENYLGGSISYPYLEWTASTINGLLPKPEEKQEEETKSAEEKKESSKEDLKEKVVNEIVPKFKEAYKIDPERMQETAYQEEQRQKLEALIENLNE